MSNSIHYSNCPVCNSNNIIAVFNAQDYTVSKQQFSIWQCNNCTCRFTQEVPGESSISQYYQSEEYISHTDTGKGWVNRLYHLVRKRTLVSKRKMIERNTRSKNGSLLDVGSGTGAFINEMKNAGWQVAGLEPDKGARELAAELYGAELKHTSELFDLTASSFDTITLWHVLEHVHDLHGYVEQLKRLLKTNGRLFIAVPNYTSYDARKYNEYWAAYDVPRHLYHFSPQSMQTLMQIHGLKINTYKPMWYDSFYVSLLSSKYKNGSTNFISAGVTGFISNLKALFNTQQCSSVIYIISK